ncbi:hypothetical protein MRS44_001970 [Fusarium solani]|uniref:uncharacterized protein n=1 Tax=Fusarium solani TaxID=169388 RepID=UPI0032C4196B|nr:hypothetical protein MRS44_001970 [Fusarium solani]
MAENVKVRYNEIIDDSFLEVYADYVVLATSSFTSRSGPSTLAASPPKPLTCHATCALESAAHHLDSTETARCGISTSIPVKAPSKHDIEPIYWPFKAEEEFYTKFKDQLRDL